LFTKFPGKNHLFINVLHIWKDGFGPV